MRTGYQASEVAPSRSGSPAPYFEPTAISSSSTQVRCPVTWLLPPPTDTPAPNLRSALREPAILLGCTDRMHPSIQAIPTLERSERPCPIGPARRQAVSSAEHRTIAEEERCRQRCIGGSPMTCWRDKVRRAAARGQIRTRGDLQDTCQHLQERDPGCDQTAGQSRIVQIRPGHGTIVAGAVGPFMTTLSARRVSSVAVERRAYLSQVSSSARRRGPDAGRAGRVPQQEVALRLRVGRTPRSSAARGTIRRGRPVVAPARSMR